METLKLNSLDLSSLKDVCKIIKIRLDNSVNIIDEMGGPDYFYIKIDTTNNTAIPLSDDANLSLMEKYTRANYAGIYEAYIECGSFEGCFSIYSADDNHDWNLDFQGSELQDESGDLNENQKEKIVEIINPKSLYLLANEVLEACLNAE